MNTATGERTDLYGDPLPAGAVARLGTLRFRSANDSSQSLEFIPGDHRLVAAGANGGVGIWDPQTGKILREFQTPGKWMFAFDVAPDGSRIATLSRKIIPDTREVLTSLHVWFTDSGGLDREIQLTGDKDLAGQSLAFSPDSRSVAIGTTNGSIRIYDLTSRQEVLSHQTVKGEIESIAFSPDGELIAAASLQGVALWPWLTDKEPILLLNSKTEHQGARSVSFSWDGKWLATGSDERGGLRVWDVAAGTVKWRTGRDQWHLPGRMEFTRDNRALVAAVRQAQGAQIQLLDTETGKPLRTFNSDTLGIRIALSSDGEWIAVHGHTRVIQVFRTGQEQKPNDRFVGHNEHVSQVAFTSDGSRVITSCYRTDVRMWDAETGKPLKTIDNGTTNVTHFAISPDDRFLATAAFDQTTRVFNLESGKLIYSLAGHARLGAYRANVLEFAADGRLRSFGPDLFLRIWNMGNGKAVAEHDVSPVLKLARSGDSELPPSNDPFSDEMEGRSLTRALISRDGKVLVLQRGGELTFIDVDSGKEVRRLTGTTSAFDISADHRRVVICESSRQARGSPAVSTIRVRDLVSDEVVSEISGIPGSIYEIVFSPDGKSLAASIGLQKGSMDYRFFITTYDAENGKELARIDASERALSIAFSPNGERLVAGYMNTTAIVWDLAHFRK